MSAAVENKGAERSAALPRAGFSQRQSRAHIATVRSADWTQAVLSLTPGSARLLARSPGFLSTWQHGHVFFAPLKNSAVFRQLEREDQ